MMQTINVSPSIINLDTMNKQQDTNIDIKTHDECSISYDECSICYDKDDTVVKMEVCGHTFHMRCIQQHFKPECAICRLPLNIKVYGDVPKSNISYLDYVYDDVDMLNNVTNQPYHIEYIDNRFIVDSNLINKKISSITSNIVDVLKITIRRKRCSSKTFDNLTLTFFKAVISDHTLKKEIILDTICVCIKLLYDDKSLKRYGFKSNNIEDIYKKMDIIINDENYVLPTFVC